MSEPRTFASLSSGLLARKGAAKPAMRPQGFGQMGMGLEDLGWNDMGYAAGAPEFDPQPQEIERVPSKISALTPAPRGAFEEEPAPPQVVEQQRAIAASFADEEPVEAEEPQATAAVVPMAPRRRPAPARAKDKMPARAKAAFTLRLDPDRHLRLRLAGAVTRRSAQQIVSEALDNFLETLPELDTVAKQLPAQAGKRN
jgi:hypothetical protein